MTKLMARFHAKRVGLWKAEWDITPHYAEKLENEKKWFKFCKPVCAAKGLWQVTSGNNAYAVNLENKTCGCGKWDLTGLPCKHGVCAIYKSKESPEDYVSDFFKKPIYISTHHHIVFLVPGQLDWTKTATQDVDPHVFLVHAGRKKKNRRKSQDEKENPVGRERMTTATCSNCQMQDHKYSSCAQPLKPELALRKNKHKRKRTTTEAGPSSVDPSSGVGPSSLVGPSSGPTTPPVASPASPPAPRKPASPRNRARHVAPVKLAFKPPRETAAPAPAARMTRSRQVAQAHAAPGRPSRTTAGQLPARYSQDGPAPATRGKLAPVRGRRTAGVQPPRLWISLTEGGGCK